MIQHSEIFQLLAEIAVAVAGFAGVATVFGGRERIFNISEVLRLRALFQFSALVLAGSLGLLAIDAAGISSEKAIIYISVALALATTICALDVPWKAFKLRGKVDSVTPLSLAIGFSPSVLCVPLILYNALFLRQEWLLIAVLSYYVLVTLWAFYRLLVNRN